MSLKSRESHCGLSDRTKRIASLPGTLEGRRVGRVREVLPELRTLEHLAEFSPRHAAVLRSLTSERADDRRRQTLMEWCDHVRGGGADRLSGGRTADRDAGRSSLLPEMSELLEWDPAQPRAPKGQADGGQWVGKKGGARGREDWDQDAKTYTLNAKSGHPQLDSPRGGRWVVRKGSSGLKGGFDPGGVLFIPNGEAVPPRKKSGTATRVDFDLNPLPPELVEAGLGHHFTALAAAASAGIFERLSRKAREYFAGSTSGATDPSHRNSTYGEVTHPRYNKEVKSELKKFVEMKLGNDKRRKLDEYEAAEFDDLVRKGKGANGRKNKIIFKYNNGLEDDIIGGPKRRPSVQDVVKKGRALGKNPRFRKFLAAGLITAGLGEVFAQQSKAGEVAAKSDHLRQALDALQRGDVDEAERHLIGHNDSLYVDLLAKERANLLSANVASAYYIAVRKLFTDPGLAHFFDDFDSPEDDEGD